MAYGSICRKLLVGMTRLDCYSDEIYLDSYSIVGESTIGLDRYIGGDITIFLGYSVILF